MPSVTARLIALVLALVACGTHAAEPADFDYYVLSLSWSPQHCFETGDRLDNRQQCRAERRYGFIVHGLWPQREQGAAPDTCRPVPPLDDDTVERFLPMMPSAGLMQHEWRRHGSCSGLAEADYLGLAEDLYANLSIPPAYRDPAGIADQRTTPQTLKAAFIAANPALPPEAIVPVCRYQTGKVTQRDGLRRWLDEVRLCYTKDGHARACGPTVYGNCGRGEIAVRSSRE